MMRLLRVVASLALLAGVVWLVQPAEVLGAMRGLHPGWLALAVAALVAQIFLSALRWRVTAGALGHDLPRLWALREYGLSVAVNTFLPGGVMGDLARILRARGLGWQGATASVLVERLAGQVALGVLVLGGLVVWLGAQGMGITLAVGGAIFLSVRVWPGPAALLAQTWGAPGVWPWQLGLTVAILAVNLAGFWAAAQAVGVTLGAGAALVLIPLTLLSMLIPLTINGWGLREGVAAALWPLWGVVAAQAVAASVAFGLACMAAAALGMLPWLWRGRAAAIAPAQD